MHRINLTAMHRRAAQNLEDSLRHFDQSPGGLAQEFVELKLQASIFQYDVCAEMIGFLRNKPTGFASAVALKGLVLRLYEYDNVMNTSLIPRLLTLAKERSVPFDSATVREARSNWKQDLKRLRQWSSLRNQAAGHYGRNMKSQVAVLRRIDPVEVMTVARAFLSFNMAYLVGLRATGRGVAGGA